MAHISTITSRARKVNPRTLTLSPSTKSTTWRNRPVQHLLSSTIGKRVGGWNEGDDWLRVDVIGSVRGAACPSCSRRSSRVHGRYRRRLDDRPSFGQRVTLSLEVRRFKCVNPNCVQHTFSEQPHSLVARSQRRTQRLNESLRSLGYSLERVETEPNLS
jgi:hypothetical protein